MVVGYIALAGRIAMLGVERIVVKQLGSGAEGAPATLVFFGITSLFLLPLALVAPAADWSFLPYCFVSGLVYVFAFIFYLRSLGAGEVSLVAPLYNINVFFLLVLGAAVLGEPITVLKVGGLVVLLYGTSLLNGSKGLWGFWRGLKMLAEDKACRMMIAASLFIAVGRVIDGAYSRGADAIGYATGTNVAVTVYLFMYVAFRGKLNVSLALLKSRPAASIIAGIMNAYSYLLLLVAFRTLDVSVAEPASMLSSLVTVVLGRFIFGEKIGSRMLGAAVMVAGAWLLFL